MKNLIIDCQILQTNAWFRGMGKYTIKVLQELDQYSSSELEISLIFNSSIICDSDRFDTIKFLCPNSKQFHWALPLASDESAQADDYKSKLEDNVTREFKNIDNYYLITSLFYFDFFTEFPHNCKKLLLFYDLTPLLFWRDLGGYFPPDIYMARFQKLYESEIIFCISNTTKNDLLSSFGLDPATLININGGFTKISKQAKKPSSFKVPSNYILFPTGDLPHKNNKNAIKGFEQYCQSLKQSKPLLVTSHFSEESQRQLLLISDKIIFTDNVPDEELEWLYINADSILFASKYEGLGLPVLDAVANNKPIIASKIPVFEEMSEQAFYYFDPNSPVDLAAALIRADEMSGFPSMATHYPKIMEKYSWHNTGKLVIDCVKEFKIENKDFKPKKNIILACLNPGSSDQIGRTAEALHFSLSQKFNVDYYFDANGLHYTDLERPTFLDYIDCKTFDIAKLDVSAYRDYDAIIYLMDKSSLPSRLAQRASIFPGVAVTGSTEGLNDQEEMFKELVLNNQYEVYFLKSNSYKHYQELTSLIDSDVSKQLIKPNTKEQILRSEVTPSRAIKELKELES